MIVYQSYQNPTDSRTDNLDPQTRRRLETETFRLCNRNNPPGNPSSFASFIPVSAATGLADMETTSHETVVSYGEQSSNGFFFLRKTHVGRATPYRFISYKHLSVRSADDPCQWITFGNRLWQAKSTAVRGHVVKSDTGRWRKAP